RLQPEYRRQWAERWSLKPAPRIPGPLVWVHAVSVGETRAAQPLIAALLEQCPKASLLLTHMTPTGRKAGQELFAGQYVGRLVQAYLPYDYPGAMRRFLVAWKPKVGIIIETELWPNLCAQAVRMEIPLALVNARLSERSLRKGLRWHSLVAPAMRSLRVVVAQTDGDAQRIRHLGREHVQVAGNLKFDVTVPQDLFGRGRAWRSMAGGRPVLLAASTRDGEEALLLDAWLAAASAAGALPVSTPAPTLGSEATRDANPATNPLLLIVPRHPQRFDAVANQIERRGLRFARRAALDDEQAESVAQADVLLGDSMGEMFAYYAMADVAIIGGSLLPFGGQNLIEACAAGVPVIIGPHTYNFADAAVQAIEAEAAVRVADAPQAIEASLALLGNAPRRARMSNLASQFAQAHQGAARRTLEMLSPWLPA
ncbi:MAG: lipid IV(A) 3-deoxy-D-manno-octulosonic acid transferase, partial [Quisquiliibacterium sp.]